jgi:hypothetical protein
MDFEQNEVGFTTWLVGGRRWWCSEGVKEEKAKEARTRHKASSKSAPCLRQCDATECSCQRHSAREAHSACLHLFDARTDTMWA